MINRSQNPFLSRANSNRLMDDEVRSLWVDVNAATAQHPVFDPANPMPSIALGGKGSGKTHLFRYHSFPVQGLRYDNNDGEDWSAGLKRDGYVGIYTRADGLSSSRFVGKGVADEQWHVIFKHYVEIWLAQGLLDVLIKLAKKIESVNSAEEDITRRAMRLVGAAAPVGTSSFKDLADALRKSQQEIDRQVNAAAFTRKIEPQIFFSPGDLIYGLPALVSERIALLKDVLYCYYIDECENLMESQQRYVNTLVREARPRVTFRVGVRSYGMRTYQTDTGDGESITEGSEFQRIGLDEKFRAARQSYRKFAKTLLELRLKNFETTLFAPAMDLTKCFGTVDPTVSNVIARTGLNRLSENLRRFDADCASEVLELLAWPDDLLAERAAIFMFYKGFAEGRDDLECLAAEIRSGLEGKDAETHRNLSSTKDHYRGDFLAQMLRGHQGERSAAGGEYSGLEAFIKMSEGIPRSLLTGVGNVVHCAAFRGEVPIREGSISVLSQLEGAKDSADRFFRDLPKVGAHSDRIWGAVQRLGELFRLSRFSDKPVECSLIGFSLGLESASQEVKEVIDEAEKRSFLIRSRSPQKGRWSNSTSEKFHLNRTLAPRYDLPISIRGRAAFGPEEVEAIFGREDDGAFRRVLATWDARLNWPFGRDGRREERLF